MGDCFPITGQVRGSKKATPCGAAFEEKLEMDYRTVTVSCVLWTVFPETAVMVKV